MNNNIRTFILDWINTSEKQEQLIEAIELWAVSLQEVRTVIDNLLFLENLTK